jgi:hypothetical protein
MLRFNLSNQLDWNIFYPINELACKNEDYLETYKLYQIEFASDKYRYSHEHILTIYNGYVLQSYFNRYPLSKTFLTINPLKLYNESINLEHNDALWKTFVDNEPPDKYEVIVTFPS